MMVILRDLNDITFLNHFTFYFNLHRNGSFTIVIDFFLPLNMYLTSCFHAKQTLYNFYMPTHSTDHSVYIWSNVLYKKSRESENAINEF